MLCVVALVVFGVMGIFSATHRALAREAFDCTFRMATLRPCDTGFDQKIKGKIVGKVFKKSPKAAGLIHKNYKVVSWCFTILFFGSMIYTGYGAYNLLAFGTCDPTDPTNCVFNPQDPSASVCPFHDYDLSLSAETVGYFRMVNEEPRPFAYFFGATWCPHCGWEKPIFTRVSQKFPSVTTHIIEVDLEPDHPEIATFKHYSPLGNIPIVILGGKYYRIGAGEALGEETEELLLTALFCKISGNEASDCSEPEVQAYISQL
ncbi:MAG: thioredoxin family protein [Candidatus Diapherotrites archaeon]|nr:thioredoxin family protein [Candidatus Diapherotrites archaeon]